MACLSVMSVLQWCQNGTRRGIKCRFRLPPQRGVALTGSSPQGAGRPEEAGASARVTRPSTLSTQHIGIGDVARCDPMCSQFLCRFLQAGFVQCLSSILGVSVSSRYRSRYSAAARRREHSMRFLARLFYSLVMALILLNMAIGGIVPLWAQQLQPSPWQPAGSGGMFSDGFGQTPSVPAGPSQPIPLQMAPSAESRFQRPAEVARPVIRQCAAEASWQRVPAIPQPLQVPPQQVVRLQQPPLTTATPPQQVLTPGIDPTRTAGPQPQTQTKLPGQTESRDQPQEQMGLRDDQPQRQPGVRETLSPIELSFGDLRQFGYTVFSSPVSTFAPVDDVPVGPDYVLGPGDNMVINISGMMDGLIARTVDRNGRVILPKVGPLRVWGLTFSQADRIIREELARYFRGFQTTVTLGRLRTIRVHIPFDADECALHGRGADAAGIAAGGPAAPQQSPGRNARPLRLPPEGGPNEGLPP